MSHYRITRIRSGFWIVKNLYHELVFEGHSFIECKTWTSKKQGV